ncbi:MAG TPA: hypothetical protein VNJ02_14480 [Vicinamibacterales bacterium]|nr:hypothetical protein [Vicinamibacterales bacterium]
MLETRNGRGYIKHYMFDFGSILGSGTIFAQRRRAGNEYIFELQPGWRTLATLGLYLRPWLLVDYPDVPPSIGRFEGDAFEPARWKPEYRNPAFENMRPDDAFWAARIVAKFSNERIAAIVGKARYSDPRASAYLTETLIKRRDKVLRTWLNGVNPVVDADLSASGELTFANAAVAAGVAEPAARYDLQWFRYDNATDSETPLAEPAIVDGASGAASSSLPAALLTTAAGNYIGVRITTRHPSHPAWARPATFFFRRSADGWSTVGAER